MEIFDYLVNERCWVIIFWTCSVQVPVVEANVDGTLSLIYKNQIGNQFC